MGKQTGELTFLIVSIFNSEVYEKQVLRHNKAAHGDHGREAGQHSARVEKGEIVVCSIDKKSIRVVKDFKSKASEASIYFNINIMKSPFNSSATCYIKVDCL